MKAVQYIVCFIVLCTTCCTMLQPYVTNVVASYLSPFILLSFPLAIINFVFAVFAIYFRSKWKWVFSLTSLYFIYTLSYSFRCLNSPKSQKVDSDICLVSWNVDNFRLSIDTLKHSSCSIKSYNPDIICLQERPHTNLLSWETICKTFGYPYTNKNSREDEVLNLAVLSIWPLSNLKEYYFPDTYNKFFQVDVAHPTGMIRLFNVHLQTTGMNGQKNKEMLYIFQKNSYQRLLQLDELLEAIKQSPYPVIVAGDFNDVPFSKVYKNINSILQDGFLQAGKGWGATFQNFGKLFRIDYVFVSDEFRILNYQLLDNFWSDHRIQICKLKVHN